MQRLIVYILKHYSYFLAASGGSSIWGRCLRSCTPAGEGAAQGLQGWGGALWRQRRPRCPALGQNLLFLRVMTAFPQGPLRQFPFNLPF